MRKLQSVSLILLYAAVCVMSDVITTRGPEGGTVHIKCPYDQGWETYGKYFYKGIWADRVSVVNTIENQQISWTDDGKYNLSDDMENRVFTVTISNLTQQDAGTYWCYTHGRVLELKTEVNLTVDRASSSPSRSLYFTTQPSTDSTNSTTANQDPDTINNPIYFSETNQNPGTHDIMTHNATSTSQHPDDNLYSNVVPHSEAQDSVNYVALNLASDSTCLPKAMVSSCENSDSHDHPEPLLTTVDDTVMYSTISHSNT